MLNSYYNDSHLGVRMSVPAGTVAGNPVLGGGSMPGVAVNDRGSDGTTIVRRNCACTFTVNGVDQGGNSAVMEGDLIYFTLADPIKLSKKNTGVPYGRAILRASDPSGSVLVAAGASGPVVVSINMQS